MGNSTALFACHMGYEEWGFEWDVFKFVTCHFSAVFSDNVFWGKGDRQGSKKPFRNFLEALILLALNGAEIYRVRKNNTCNCLI